MRYLLKISDCLKSSIHSTSSVYLVKIRPENLHNKGVPFLGILTIQENLTIVSLTGSLNPIVLLIAILATTITFIFEDD